jgi:hypothetical protein
MIKIETSGDYVQLIYVDPVGESVQQELKSDTDAFEVSYDSEGKLYMQFGAMTFQNPDPTDFVIDGVAVTDAADFIGKLNALFTGGGGGGATIYTADGSLPEDRTVSLNGHTLFFNDGDVSHIMLALYPEAGEERSQIRSFSSETANAVTELSLFSSDDSGYKFNLFAYDATNTVSINGDATDNSLTHLAGHHNFNLLEFADNAAAVTGGLVAGDLYHTAGAVKIVIP